MSYESNLKIIQNLDLTAVTRERLSAPRTGSSSSGTSAPAHVQSIFTPSQHVLRNAFILFAMTAATVAVEKNSDAAPSAIDVPTAVTAAGPVVER